MSTKTLEKNVLLDMKPDVPPVPSGYSLDMLGDLLTIAEYTSLYFYLKPSDVMVTNGITYVKESSYKRWASQGF